jgi:uncharacterized protein
MTRVRRIDHAWVPMSDGARLAARIWLPEDAATRPVPAVLEYQPYRKNDVTSVRDEGRHGWFARRGYASIRIDVRGTGDSDGILLDEYLAQEQDDGVDAVAWIAQQPWCSGAVGMIGYSWGGFSALQVAARRPPALRAIVTVDSSDDRYADDVHYMGGCVLACDMLPWASSMDVYARLPPDPEVVGERWRETWMARLESARPMIEPWLSHQRRDGYWRHGSVCEDLGAIECPVYAVSGWADGYRNAVLRLLAGLPGPRKGLIGPWPHTMPVESVTPGPAIGFLQECARWWDQWLLGLDTGIMDEPMLRVWMQDSMPPRTAYRERPGRWVTEPGWPSPNIVDHHQHLGDGVLRDEPQPSIELQHRGAQHHGLYAGEWDPHGGPADLPPDQRAEDGLALTFTSAPLREPLELLGRPVARLRVAGDQPVALVSVRLCDVFPDGRSCLITRGLQHLTHRDGDDQPRPLVPGEQVEVEVAMKAIGQVVPAGHRLRLAVSTTYWPWAWPSPKPVELTLLTGASRLTLPIRPPREEPEPAPFEAPELAPRPSPAILETGAGGGTATRDIATGRFSLVRRFHPRERLVLQEAGIEIACDEPDTFTIQEDDPLSAVVRCERRFGLARGDGWRTRVESESEMRANHDSFEVWTSIRAFDGEECIFTRTWTFVIPRDGV